MVSLGGEPQKFGFIKVDKVNLLSLKDSKALALRQNN